MFKPLELPTANAVENAPYEGLLISEGLHVKGYCAVIEKVSDHASLPLDQSRPASSSSLSLRDVNEPLTLRMDVDSRIDSLLDIFNIAVDTPSSSLAGYSTFKGEFKHYYN
jgi:hypothetical protein